MAVGWYSDNSDHQAHPVGQKQANDYGLYDMTGNVSQWMEDKFNEKRAHRGVSWSGSSRYVRAVTTDMDVPVHRDEITGFRLVRTIQ